MVGVGVGGVCGVCVCVNNSLDTTWTASKGSFVAVLIVCMVFVLDFSLKPELL